MYQVIKRDGHAAEFSLNRISSAIMKAFDATHIPYAPDVIDRCVQRCADGGAELIVHEDLPALLRQTRAPV